MGDQIKKKLKRVFVYGNIAQLYEINFKFSTFDQLLPSNTPLCAGFPHANIIIGARSVPVSRRQYE
jgi:hypothetical protein